MNSPAIPESRKTLEDKAMHYIEHNTGKCWAFVLLVCAAGVLWRNSWV